MGLSLLSLKGLTALVTGGGSGLGRQMALGLAEAGASVVVCGRRPGALDDTVRMVESLGGKATAINCDITSETDVKRLGATGGHVDILVNNAGYTASAPWETVPLAEFRKVFEVNLDAAFRLCQLYGPQMRDRGWGRIINVSSIYGRLAGDPSRYPGLDWDEPAYFASKHGLHGVTCYLAARLAPHGVCVNTLSPGMFPNTSQDGAMTSPPLIARLIDGTPMRRVGVDDDLKAAVVFLASPGAKFMTGQDLVVDGGWSIW